MNFKPQLLLNKRIEAYFCVFDEFAHMRVIWGGMPGQGLRKFVLSKPQGRQKKKRKEALFIADAISDEQSRLPS